MRMACEHADDRSVIQPPGRARDDNEPMRILVIEDETSLAQTLQRGLSEHGHVVDTVPDGVDGLHLAVEGSYDLLLIDVMLPGLDGFGVLQALRRSRDTPVLMLTARDGVADRVRGLQGGADDYLVKPFAFAELLARVDALLRRGGAERSLRPSTLAFADLEVDLLARRAVRSGVRLNLTAKEFKLLALMLRRQGEVLSRTVLADQVWDMNFDSDTNVIDVAVRRLRRKLDDPFERKLLHTVRGMGYVLKEEEA